jgi:hypothetical protein
VSSAIADRDDGETSRELDLDEPTGPFWQRLRKTADGLRCIALDPASWCRTIGFGGIVVFKVLIAGAAMATMLSSSSLGRWIPSVMAAWLLSDVWLLTIWATFGALPLAPRYLLPMGIALVYSAIWIGQDGVTMIFILLSGLLVMLAPARLVLSRRMAFWPKISNSERPIGQFGIVTLIQSMLVAGMFTWFARFARIGFTNWSELVPIFFLQLYLIVACGSATWFGFRIPRDIHVRNKLRGSRLSIHVRGISVWIIPCVFVVACICFIPWLFSGSIFIGMSQELIQVFAPVPAMVIVNLWCFRFLGLRWF